MNNPMGIYVSRLAEAARCMCNEKEITKSDQRLLDENALKKIVEFYKGTLVQYSEARFAEEFPNRKFNSFLRKATTDNSLFVIGYVEYSAIDILHELGHAFLELSSMVDNEIRWIGDSESGLKELEAYKFARAFLMPTQLFQETVISCSNRGECDIEAVAKEFAVDAAEVVCRGRESYLWE